MKNKTSYKTKTLLAFTTFNNLGKANNYIQEKVHDYMKSTGLPPAQFAIINILGNEGALRISEIYEKMLIKSGNRTMILDSIEKKGFIKRVFSKHDRREIIIELTPTGEKFFEEHNASYMKTIEDVLSVFSQEEQKTLNKILNKPEISK
jgi:DNA-binding MarR family transcriptional regulator